MTAAGDGALIALSTPSEAGIERTVAEMVEGKYVNRKFGESMDVLRAAGAEILWFIDLDEGFHSRGILGTWSEVVQGSSEG